MKVRVRPFGTNVVTVHVEPSRLERILLGRTVIDDHAVYVGGPARWIWDSTGSRIRSKRILDAIERATAQ